MKFTLDRIAGALFLGMMLGCSAAAQKVDHYAATGVSFAQYKTYKWQRADKALYPEQSVDEMFMRTIDAELLRKGLKRTDNGDADLIATYQIAITEDMEWSAGKSTIPWQGMAGVPGLQGGSVGGTNVIKKGLFIFDFFDVKLNRQVWEARATKSLANTTDPGKRENNTQKVMAKIFKNYPAQAK